jgi:hypothetical protein
MREAPAMDALEGIAEADRHLGRPVPLPSTPLPLARWVDVLALGPEAVEVAWSLDDSRAGAPGRLALYAGTSAPAPRELVDATPSAELEPGMSHRQAPLADAQPSLRPVHELHWQRDGLHLRLTAQGPWALDDLMRIAQGVG